MAELVKVEVSFRLRGSKLDPDEVTAALGITPSSGRAKGELLSYGGTQPTGVWLVKSGDVEKQRGYGVLDSHLRSLLDRLEGKTDIIRGYLKRRYRADFYCSGYMEIQNEGTEISPDTIRRIAALGAALNLSVWIPADLM